MPNLNLTWCLVPKVASTSISKLILTAVRNNKSLAKRKVHWFDEKDPKNIQNELWRVFSRPYYDPFQNDKTVR